MLFTFHLSDPSSRSLATAGGGPANRSAGTLLRRALSRVGLSRFGRPSAFLATLRRPRPQSAFHPDEPGDATLRDLGLDSGSQPSPYPLVDIDPAMESTRMRLFVMTGSYWRGS